MTSAASSPDCESDPAHDDEPDRPVVEPSILERIVQEMVTGLRAQPDLPPALLAALHSDDGTDVLSSSSQTETAIREAVGAVER